MVQACILDTVYVNRTTISKDLCPDVRPWGNRALPFSRNSTAAARLSVNCRGRNSHCCNRQPAHYQKVSKALLQPLPPQIVSQTYLVISLFFPSSIHSSGLCYVVSPDTPFLSRGSWLLLMLLRKSLPPESYSCWTCQFSRFPSSFPRLLQRLHLCMFIQQRYLTAIVDIFFYMWHCLFWVFNQYICLTWHCLLIDGDLSQKKTQKDSS